MLTSIARSFGPIVSTALLLVMYVYIFANMAQSLFTNLQENGIITDVSTLEYGLLNPLSLLFQIIAGDEYFKYVESINLQFPSCDPNFKINAANKKKPYQGPACGPVYTAVWFSIFVLFANWLLLPLFIATLIDKYIASTDGADAYVTPADLENYKEAWQTFEEPNDRGHRKGVTKIWMMRPLIEQLAKMGCSLGFSVSSEPRKWQAVKDDIFALNREHGTDESKFEVRFADLIIVLLLRRVELEELTVKDYYDKDRLKKELVSKAKALEKGAEFYELNV